MSLCLFLSLFNGIESIEFVVPLAYSSTFFPTVLLFMTTHAFSNLFDYIFFTLKVVDILKVLKIFLLQNLFLLNIKLLGSTNIMVPFCS